MYAYTLTNTKSTNIIQSYNMKKLLLLGAAAILGFSSVHADSLFTEGSKVETVNDLTTGKYVLVALSKGNEKLLKFHNQTSATNRFSEHTYLPDTGVDGDFIWDITVTGEGENKTFTIKPAYHDCWFSKIGQQGGNDNVAKGNVQSTTNEDDIATFKLVAIPESELNNGTFETPGTRFYVQLTNNTFNGTSAAYFYTNGSGTDQKLSLWETTGTFFGSGACTAMMFVKITETFNGDLTINWPDLNGGHVSKTITAAEDGTLEIPAFQGFTKSGDIVSVYPKDHTDATLSLTGTWANWIQLPMNTPMRVRLRNGNANNNTYYFMKYMHTANQTKSIDLTQADNANIEPERIWYFKNTGFDAENGVQTVTLHNLAEPDNKGLTIGAGNSNRPSFSTSPTILSLAPNTKATGGFSLRRGTSGNVYINDYNGDGGLSIWVASAATNDNGTHMSYALLSESEVANMTTYPVAGVGDFAYDAEKKAAAQANVSVDKLREMVQFIGTSDIATNFTDNHYYRMGFARHSGYSFSVAEGSATAGNTDKPLSDADADRKIKPLASSAADANQIWQIICQENSDHVKITTPNGHNYYMGYRGNDGDGLSVTKYSQYAGEFILTYDISQQGWLFEFNGKEGKYLSNWGGGNGQIGQYGGGYGDAGNKIIVTLAETIDYTIPEGAEYGAVCYPFGIVLPEGVTAYIATRVNATESGSSLRLVQVPGNSVPENTPVLIKNSGEGTIHFGIQKIHVTPTEQELLNRNILSGTLIKTKGFTDIEHYLLNASGSAFTKDASDLVAANTPYMLASVPNAGADEITLAEPVVPQTYTVTFQFPKLNGYTMDDYSFTEVLEGTKVGELCELCNGLPVSFTFNNSEDLNNTAVEDIEGDNTKTVKVSGTWGYPAIEFGRVYRIAFRNKASNDCNNIILNANGQVGTRNNTNADDLVPERLFYFKEAEGSTPDNVKVTVHSVKLGDSKGFELSKNDAGKTNGNSKINLTETPDVFEVVSTGNTGAEYTSVYAFVLKATTPTTETNDGYLNDVGGTLGIWYNGATARNDGGSTFKFFDIAESEIDGIGASEELIASAKETMNHSDFMDAFSDAAITIGTEAYEAATGVPVSVGERASVPGYVPTSNANAVTIAQHLASDENVGANYSGIKAAATAIGSAATSLDVKEGTLLIFKSTEFDARGYLRNADGILRGTVSMGTNNDDPDDNYKFAFVVVDGVKYLYNLGGDAFMNAFGEKTDRDHAPLQNAADFTWRLNEVATPFNNLITYQSAIPHSIAIRAGRTPSINTNFTGIHEGGLTIIGSCTRSVLVTMGGVHRTDGNGLIASYAGQLSEEELAALRARISAANSEVAEAHETVATYMQNRIDDHNTAPGHYNEAAYGAFADIMNQADDESEHSHKHYLISEAHKAANAIEGGAINEFAHEGVYNLYENGSPLAAKIVWDDADGMYFRLEVGTFDAENDAATTINWLCSIDEGTGAVEFTHAFDVHKNAVRTDSGNSSANQVRSRVAAETRREYISMSEPAVPTYDGLGNITLGDKHLVSSSALTDAETTGITEIATTDNADATIYDLQGRRVAKASRGLYIVNGRKQLLK